MAILGNLFDRNFKFTFSTKATKVVISLVGLAVFAASCGEDKKDDAPAAAAAPTYADVKSIVATNCVTCHAANSQEPDLSTEAALTAAKTSSLAKIAIVAAANTKPMPPSQPIGTAWNTTTDGAKVKAYLESLK